MDPTEAYYINTGSILTQPRDAFADAVRLRREVTTQMVLIPDLATDLGTPNDDYTQWTFTIRDGVKFENGQPVTADDIAFGIKRSFDRTHVPGGSVVQQRLLPGRRHLQGPLHGQRRLQGRRRSTATS